MRIMMITIAALAALVAGCATTPMEGQAVSGRSGGVYAVATVAQFGTFEHEAAPGYTRLAVARRTAARRLDQGRLTLDQARAVQSAADSARSALDAARVRADRGDRVGARDDLTAAMALVEHAEQLAQGAPR